MPARMAEFVDVVVCTVEMSVLVMKFFAMQIGVTNGAGKMFLMKLVQSDTNKLNC